MMSTENLWGSIPTAEEVKPPVTILREQAAFLGELTNKILLADVSVKRDGTKLNFSLRIIAPALDSYTYVVLTAAHSLHIYPVTVTDRTNLEGGKYPVHECENESQYKEALRSILTSERLHRVITSLLIQSKNLD
jgi:hypothetical protein